MGPNILRAEYIQERVALVLVLPILWAAFDDEMEAYTPATLRNRICTAYEYIRQLDVTVNWLKSIVGCDRREL